MKQKCELVDNKLSAFAGSIALVTFIIGLYFLITKYWIYAAIGGGLFILFSAMQLAASDKVCSKLKK